MADLKKSFSEKLSGESGSEEQLPDCPSQKKCVYGSCGPPTK